LGVKLPISRSAKVSRLVFDPPMGADMDDLVWRQVFQFQEKHGQLESLVWRRFAPEDNCVHSIGRMRETDIKLEGRDKKYVGSISTIISDILNYRNANGHGFNVVHDPKEGIHHVHICYDPAVHAPMTKNDKNELKVKLLEIFSDRSPFDRERLQ
jgi:hypothetical protein